MEQLHRESRFDDAYDKMSQDYKGVTTPEQFKRIHSDFFSGELQVIPTHSKAFAKVTPSTAEIEFYESDDTLAQFFRTPFVIFILTKENGEWRFTGERIHSVD